MGVWDSPSVVDPSSIPRTIPSRCRVPSPWYTKPEMRGFRDPPEEDRGGHSPARTTVQR